MSRPLIQLDDVSLFGKGRQVPRLQEIDGTMWDGITAVMGSSGAGKTSLLNLIAGFERPDRGNIRCEAAVFWMPPGFGLWPGVRVREHLTMTAPDRPGAEMDSLLGALELKDYDNRWPQELSQGQQARLAIARALASRAKVLVFDEPLAHVALWERPKFWAVIREWCSREGKSLVFSSHDPESVLGAAERVWVLQDGRRIYDGSVDDLYEDPPSEQLAACLGPANWITPDRAQWLFRERWEKPRAVRPERLGIDLADHSTDYYVVSATPPRNGIGRTVVKSQRDDREIALKHRPFNGVIARGAGVILHLLSLWMVAWMLVGCEGGEALPEWTFATIEHWRIPVEGLRLPAPRSLARGIDGEVVVLDNAGRVLVYEPGGRLVRQWRMPETAAGNPEGVAVLPDGRVIVCDTHYHRVAVFRTDGQLDRFFGSYGRAEGQFIYPVAVALDDEGGVYIGEYGENDRIQKFDVNGEWQLTMGSFGVEPGQFQRPSGIVWVGGRLYVADAVNNRIQVFKDTGEFCGVLGLHFRGRPIALHLPYDLECDANGRLFVVEYGAGRVLGFSLDGEVFGSVGKQGNGTGEFLTPWGLTIGTDERLCVADTGNHRIVCLGWNKEVIR